MGRRQRVFVTVGMGPFPFDRLVAAADELNGRYDVLAQIGTSSVVPRCPHVRYLHAAEFDERLRDADVVVTHAGNTVRRVQSLGRVPVAVARRPELGEMSNGHQVVYLERERRTGRVVAVDDVADLPAAVARHREMEAALLSARPCPPVVDPTALADALDRLVGELCPPATEGAPSRGARGLCAQVRDDRRAAKRSHA